MAGKDNPAAITVTPPPKAPALSPGMIYAKVLTTAWDAHAGIKEWIGFLQLTKELPDGFKDVLHKIENVRLEVMQADQLRNFADEWVKMQHEDATIEDKLNAIGYAIPNGNKKSLPLLKSR